MDSKCIDWHKYIGKNGYGRKYLNGKMINAHRALWIETNGPIPDGLVVDHICKNRKCVNLKHLRIISQQENISSSLSKTKCLSGHPLSGKNLYIKPDKRKVCMTCARIYRKRYRDN